MGFIFRNLYVWVVLYEEEDVTKEQMIEYDNVCIHPTLLSLKSS